MNPDTKPFSDENEKAIISAQKFVFYGNADVLRISDPESKSQQPEQSFREIQIAGLYCDFHPVNHFPNPNDTFRAINKRLLNGHVYVGCFTNGNGTRQTADESSEHIWKLAEQDIIIDTKAASGLARNHIRKKSRNYALPEMLGRLAYCGFETINYKEYGSITFFAVKKKQDCVHEKDHPHMLLMKMMRIGKGGKLIGVYKFRTMYPYSEYIHDYVVNLNGYNEIGKPSRDFRITPWGRFARKVWLDEVPQLINLIKGDMNIVGVRPITRFGYSSLPEPLQRERIKYKPGLIPPNVALGKTGFYGVIEAETTYLSDMKDSPFRTNLRYFFKSVFRILSFKVKSA